MKLRLLLFAVLPPATVQMADGVWAFYEHLIADSLAVEVRNSLVAGQVLGLLRNSGISTGPQLHNGLLDGPDPR